MECGRCHLTTYIVCSVCRDAHEDVDHVLRSCASTASVWCSLIKFDRVSEFFGLSIKEWIVINLTKPDYFVSNEPSRDILFGALVWNFWKARNALAFNSLIEGIGSVCEQSRRLWEIALRALALH
ncbi:hypothetical protein V6N13_130598 [Hibiscus sabdariffa]|uniref:Reverse transcriptase zinc-binding domain-containing protein n=1 Tax=Hibiscus sabdariffa TaxID=183260 RepID=A0ABR2P0W8_9ROSI